MRTLSTLPLSNGPLWSGTLAARAGSEWGILGGLAATGAGGRVPGLARARVRVRVRVRVIGLGYGLGL